MAGVGIREILMALYAIVWAVLLIAFGIRTGDWPPAETWAALGVGEGALMAIFRADEALRRDHRHAGDE
jgi:hypothetical protein